VLRACLQKWSRRQGRESVAPRSCPPIAAHNTGSYAAIHDAARSPERSAAAAHADGDSKEVSSNFTHMATECMEAEVTNMANAIGAMIRIKHGPVPRSQTAFMRAATYIYAILAPFTCDSDAGPLRFMPALIYSWLLLGVQDVSDSLENPFYYAPDHLKMDLYCRLVRDQCSAILLRSSTGRSGGPKGIAHDLSVDLGEPSPASKWERSDRIDDAAVMFELDGNDARRSFVHDGMPDRTDEMRTAAERRGSKGLSSSGGAPGALFPRGGAPTGAPLQA